MYSSKVASFLYIAVFLLLATMTQLVSALPQSAETPGEVISENRQMSCRFNQCMIRNGTNTTDAVSAANAAASSASVPIPTAATTNGAVIYQPHVVLPAMIAGTSLLLLL